MVNIVNLRRLTNKQLRLLVYLRQEGLMVSGNKAQLVERILKHVDGSVARTLDEDIEDDDENMPSSSHDDTSSHSEEESTEYEGGSPGVVHQIRRRLSGALLPSFIY